MKVITIGRSEDNDVVINDPYATRNHLQIIQHDNGGFSLSDFGSTNGTFVNGQKVSGEIVLNEMDIVRIGNTTIPWRMYFDETEQDETEVSKTEQGATEIAEQDATEYSSQGATEVSTQKPTEVVTNVTKETTFVQRPQTKATDKGNERDEILLSSTKASIILIVTMCLPIVLMMILGLWEAIGRLVIAFLFGLLAIIFSKKADKKAAVDDIEKAVKAAKNARGFNIVQIIYGVLSWIGLFIGISNSL